MLHFP